MKLIFTENAGALICAAGCDLLIDTIQTGKSRYSTPMSEKLWHMIMNRDAPFKAVDYIIATHRHQDHMSLAHILEYKAVYPETKLFLPTGVFASDLMLKKEYEKIWLNSGTLLSYYRTGHIGKDYGAVDNYCIEIESEDKRVLLTGDAEPKPKGFELMRGNFYDVVAVTPLFFHSAKGRDILNNVLCVKKVLITHIPTSGDAHAMFLQMVELDKRKWPLSEKSVVIAEKPMTSIEI